MKTDPPAASPRKAKPSSASSQRGIPSMERLLGADAVRPLIEQFGRDPVKSQLNEFLSAFRGTNGAWSLDQAVDAARAGLERREGALSPLRRVINGSGVLIHTNLGRSPVSPAIWAAAGETVSRYSNLEFDLTSGERGSRDEHLSEVARELFGAEAAVLTNNNAAATLLLLAAVSSGREVIVSRGELVEIGGSFRIPEVIQQGGAKLREVGSTNKTRRRDYEDAVTRRTGALLSVHRSNFDIVGFTESASLEDLVAVARSRKVPLLVDEGSGRVVDLSVYGLRREPTVRELLEAGADVVTCSTDKLIGATQGGLILGSSAIVEKCRRHPLMRAVRAGKESYALVGATLRAFLAGEQEALIPIYAMMASPVDSLRSRAEAIVAAAGMGTVVSTESAIGGGTTPTETLPSIMVVLDGRPDGLAERLLRLDVPVAGRIQNDRLGLDVRTILPDEDQMVVKAIRSLYS